MPDEPRRVLDVQPVFGQSLSDSGDVQAYIEVKTRPKSRRGSSRRYAGEPISLSSPSASTARSKTSKALPPSSPSSTSTAKHSPPRS